MKYQMDNPQVCVECIACGKEIPVNDPRTDTSIKLCDECKYAIAFAKKLEKKQIKERIKYHIRFKKCPLCGYDHSRKSKTCSHCGISHKQAKILKNQLIKPKRI